MRAWKILVAALLAGLVLATPAPAAVKPHALKPATQGNLVAAAKGEAYAHAKYLAYADQARRAHHPVIARLFRNTANTEFADHFLKLAAMAGVIGSNAQNLRDAIAGEGNEHTTIYPGFAQQAQAAGNKPAADMWTEFAKDEGTHLRDFEQALQAIQHPSSGAAIPLGPRVEPFPIVPGPRQGQRRDARQPAHHAARRGVGQRPVLSVRVDG